MGAETWVRAVGAASLLLASGCIGFFTPPATATASIAAPVGDAPGGPGEGMATQLRAGFRPAGLVENLYDRRYDGAAGGVIEMHGDGGAYGAYGALTYNFVTASRPDRPARVYLTGQGEWLWIDGESGPGFGLALGAEVVGFVSGGEGSASRDGFAAVAGQGEIGIGVEAGVDTRFVGSNRYALLRMGLRLRIPLSAGILFAPGLLKVFAKS